MDIFWALDFGGAGGDLVSHAQTPRMCRSGRIEVSRQDRSTEIENENTNPCLRLREVKKRASGLVRASHTDGFVEREKIEKNSETPEGRSRSRKMVVKMISESFRSSARIKLHRGKVG